MFNVVSYDRVVVDELDISIPVAQPGGLFRVNVTQDHPTFLVSLPWFISRFDMAYSSNKMSTMKLYLEPNGRIAESLHQFFRNLEKIVENRIKRHIDPTIRKYSVVEEGSTGGRYITLQIPNTKDMYACFNSSSGKEEPSEISEIRKGMPISVTVDLNEVWIDKKKWYIAPRLFQIQYKCCPQTTFLKASNSPTPSSKTSAPIKSTNKTEKQPTKTSIKFVPNLEDIIRRKNELKGSSS